MAQNSKYDPLKIDARNSVMEHTFLDYLVCVDLHETELGTIFSAENLRQPDYAF